MFATVACSANAIAQIDNDPTNDSQATADALNLAPDSAVANLAALAEPGNDVDFFSVSLDQDDVLLGMITPIDDLPTSFDVPDTFTSVLSGGVQQTFNDDDFADELPQVDTRGSLFRYWAPSAGTYHIGVTGFNDYEFDGAASTFFHEESGEYILTAGRINSANTGGNFSDTDPDNDEITGADAISLGPSGAAIAVADLLEEDVDFFRLNLLQGQVLSAITGPVDDLPFTFDFPDTLMGLFDASGTPLVMNEDAGEGGESELDDTLNSDFPYDEYPSFASAIRALIPADGVYYLGVTGFDDLDFTGLHVEFGLYALLIGVAAGPAALPGDFNMDGMVDAADYVVWRKNEGTLYDQDDYNDWRANFGRSIDDPQGSSLAGVPEPATFMALLAIIAVYAPTIRKRLA
ncbi:MAG TPA: hypothetical protein VGK58_21185 [Lacipirellulaceae bacterium]